MIHLIEVGPRNGQFARVMCVGWEGRGQDSHLGKGVRGTPVGVLEFRARGLHHCIGGDEVIHGCQKPDKMKEKEKEREKEDESISGGDRLCDSLREGRMR